MFQKLRNFFKSKQKGQSMIFFAVSFPITMAFIGMAMDFGFLYLNQSRLQNAADAAAKAGASSLIGDEMPLSDYSYTVFVPNSDSGLQELIADNIISNRVKDKSSSYTGSDKVTYAKPVAGDSLAKTYAKNILQGWLGATDIELVENNSIGLVEEGDKKVENINFNSILYGKNTEDYESLYYTVTLTAELEHLFGGILDNMGVEKMPYQAMAAVKITHVPDRIDNDLDTPHGPNLYDQMKAKEVAETYPNWEEIKVQKGNNATAANNRSVLTGGASYTSGNLYRTEVSLLNGNAFASSRGNPSNTGVDQKQFDDLFIDFQGEMNKGLETNGDHDLDISKTSGNWDYGDKLSGNLQYSYRVHFPIMINSTYPIRTGKEPPDCLYAFIEQEPIKQYVYQSDGTNYLRGNMSSVRQIIINNNIANTNASKDRPLIFFYEGPEIPLKEKKPKLYDSDGDYIGARPFLPVILNLNKDFRGIVFAPNNPVCINGNGYKMEGFVVAREFRRLKTSTDFDNAVDSDNNKMYVKFKFGDTTENAYGEISTMQDVTSSFPDSITIAGLTYVKAKSIRKVNRRTYWDDCYVQDGQWYTNQPADGRVQIDLNGDTTKYAYTTKLIYPATYNSKTYIITASSRFYVPVTSETVTYSSGTILKQNLNTMYISGSAYTYTESYMNTSGKQKTKTSIMSIGDVQFVNINASDASNSAGEYTEKPGDVSSFTEDDKLRYDYVDIFNLNANSTYNSFFNVGLVNYTYLKKTEGHANTSHDMFFTTVRSKHID